MLGHPDPAVAGEGSLATEWSHLFSLVLYRFDREVHHSVRDDSAIGRWALSVERWALGVES